MPEKFLKQKPEEEKKPSEAGLEGLSIRALVEGLMAAEASERSEKEERKKTQREFDLEKEEMLSRIKDAGGMAKFQEMVEEEMRRTGGETELDRAKAIKSVIEKLI